MATASEKSLITSGIDFDAVGKQCDFLRLPHSVTRSAYGWLPSPIVCVKNGDGPTVLLMAGVHGDEFEGQVGLAKLIGNLDVEKVRGRIIILPMANFPAAKASQRISPIDDINLNRAFPGASKATLTHQIAHYIETQLMPMADFVFDLHSGGSSLHYLPTTLLLWSEDEAARAEQIAFANVFGSDFACFFKGDHGGTSSSAAALRQGVKGVSVELGGSGRVSMDALRTCERGIANLLDHIGVVEGFGQATDTPKPRLLQAMSSESFVFAFDNGVFEPVVSLGDEVRVGQLAARIHDVETPWTAPKEVRFEAEGSVICQRAYGRAERGDCLFHLGCPLPTK
ncbi:MAG: deacylase [Chromatiales bacterium]|nr:deacylase [Chromatiales bacterium]